MSVTSYPSQSSISPHTDALNVSGAECRAGVEFSPGLKYRSAHVTATGGGSLVILSDAGTEVALHGLVAGTDAPPSPLIVGGILANSAGRDADFAMTIDNDAFLADVTTNFNADTGTYATMPGIESANVDGLMIGSSQPFGGLTFTHDTLGTAGTMQGSVYTGDPDAAYDAANFTAVTILGGGKDMLASGDVQWNVPITTWRPHVGPSGSGNTALLYWFFWGVLTNYTINPIGLQGQLKDFSNVGGLRLGA